MINNRRNFDSTEASMVASRKHNAYYIPLVVLTNPLTNIRILSTNKEVEICSNWK